MSFEILPVFARPDLVHIGGVGAEQPADATRPCAMNYLLSLLVGLAFGIGYALLGIKSPAPPIVALFGLLGMVTGEHGVTWVKRHCGSVAASPTPPPTDTHGRS